MTLAFDAPRIQEVVGSLSRKMLINGEWVDAASGKTFDSINPTERREAVLPTNVLVNKYWIDELYQAVFARGGLALGRGLWKGGDVGFIDGIAVDGSSALVVRIAATVRWLQSGYLYHYAFAMILGLIALLGGVWWVVGHAAP